MSHDTEEWFKIQRKTDLLIQKWQDLVNFDLNTQNSRNFYFDWFLLCKVYNIWPKKVWRSYLSWHCKICKIWRKANLWFERWHQEYDQFSLEHLKNWLWWDPSIQSEKCVSLKFTKELRVMTMKNDAKFEETFAKLTCRFKLTWGVPRILIQALKSLKNLRFN